MISIQTYRALAIPAAMLLALSACSTTPKIDKNFGSALASAKALQQSPRADERRQATTARETVTAVGTHLGGGQNASTLQPMLGQ